MQKITFSIFLAGLLSFSLRAQVCDPGVVPSGLTSTYFPGSGALLEWDVVPGSVGMQLRVDLPTGSTINRRIIGFERDRFAVPDVLLGPGIYTWRVQAACSTTAPFYDMTLISAPNHFEIDGGVPCPAAVTDIEGNVYNAVQIGSQCWMAENLKVEYYRNGDAITTGLSNAAWSITTNGAFVIYDNDATNKLTYGLLYNWFAVVDPRGLCPIGWHVPSNAEWTELTNSLGGESVAGGKMKATGTLESGTGLWHAPNTDATNSSGFSGLPGGYRSSYGPSDSKGYLGWWWSSSEAISDSAWFRLLDNTNGAVYTGGFNLQEGNSVRCLKD